MLKNAKKCWGVKTLATADDAGDVGEV